MWNKKVYANSRSFNCWQKPIRNGKLLFELITQLFQPKEKHPEKQQQQQIIRGVFRTHSKTKDRAALTKIRTNKQF